MKKDSWLYTVLLVFMVVGFIGLTVVFPIGYDLYKAGNLNAPYILKRIGFFICCFVFLWTLYSEYTDRSYSCLYKIIRFVILCVSAFFAAILFRG